MSGGPGSTGQRTANRVDAISIRQPWAWFALCEKPWAKDVENRTWPMPTDKVGKWVRIHAGKAMSKTEYEEACKFAEHAGALMLPWMDSLKRGGIVGMVKFRRSARVSESPWFTGPWGWPIEEAYPLPFQPCRGELGFFKPVIL